MIRFCTLALYLFCSVVALNSCSSEPEKKRVRTIEDDKSDSLLLVYDSKKADKRIDAYMKELHKKRGFNGNVLVAKKGKIIYQNAIGWADYLHRDSLTINSVFELASVSKPMTATAILMLAEQGKLKLDQTVNAFYPDFPYPGITIRMLLSHRSGLMNYVYFVDRLWKAQRKNESKGITNADVMKLIAEHKPPVYTKPNVKFHYNNSNFMILGAIIEKVSGMPYSQFMQENIFKPCGMKNTNVYSKAEYDKIPVDVVGHDRTWRYSVVQNFLDGPVGDKGIYSTVHDLFLFDRCLRKGKLLGKAWLDSAYTGHNNLVRGHFNYGYGWRTFEGDGHKVVYHTGWWHGFRHIYLRDLTADVTIVLLCNLTNGSLLQLDELYKMVGMPVVKKSAYTGNGDTSED
ncbi:CubicO group peptidase (beta-lactamase class C family) [Arcticibacter tournemirensis]|uniref:Beta-lactamase family protein n=1 Tax=Arcticibacter tournemirensis TaxID=699437 RepID=A0A5M9HES5_9SPHI|nr:serine hydrolase domain-containing protein [Arcticibacter tournemirensis]KAA8485482.1 beta-lactamase family protein [Arcticibacter tournemirensis]TQM48815.1 CubicO group peptidase (beta-lactamase class C family) [Arcticibacter tournemirensis]